MLAFLLSLCLIEVVNGVLTLPENNTCTFKLSGSYWTIRRWLAEDVAAVKRATEMDIFRVTPQQMPISQNICYIYKNEICHGALETFR